MRMTSIRWLEGIIQGYPITNFLTEVDDGLLLLHNMTKEMVLLSKEEQRVFEHCPTDLSELQGVLCRDA